MSDKITLPELDQQVREEWKYGLPPRDVAEYFQKKIEKQVDGLYTGMPMEDALKLLSDRLSSDFVKIIELRSMVAAYHEYFEAIKSGDEHRPYPLTEYEILLQKRAIDLLAKQATT